MIELKRRPMPIDRNIKILIVDDQQAMRALIKQALRTLGFRRFVEAESGAEAIICVQSEPDISLIFSDLCMKPMTGIHLLQAIRETYGNVPFIMITASTDKVHVFQAKEKGVDHYLMKPFNVKSIRRRIEAVFNDCF